MNKVKKQNLDIVLIILDSARRDLFGCYGHNGKLTPNIDKIGAEGLILNDHYASGCGSTQAHVGIFLGQHSARHGLVHNLSDMPSGIISFTRVLQECQYKTIAHCMASFIPPAGYEDLFGFDEFFYPGKQTNSEIKQSFKEKIITRLRSNQTLWNASKRIYKNILGQKNVIKAAAKTFDGRSSLNFLLRKLIEKDRKNPLFAYSTILHPHTPYYPPQWCIDHVFKGSKIDPLSFEIQSDMHGWVNGNYGEVASAIDSMRKMYEAELLYADSLVGEFVENLRNNGSLENTILIITSDHGEFFGEGGWLNHGLTLREELQRIPCIIHCPSKIKAGTIINQLTSALDLAPTIFDLIGKSENLEQKTILDGVSILSNNSKLKDRLLIVDSPPIVLPERLNQFKNILKKASFFYRAVRTNDYKYVWKSNGTESLYKVGDFECEKNNIIRDYPSIARSMYEKMLKFYYKVDPEFDINKYPINMGTTAAMKMTDPKIRRELIKLGYL